MCDEKKYQKLFVSFISELEVVMLSNCGQSYGRTGGYRGS